MLFKLVTSPGGSCSDSADSSAFSSLFGRIVEQSSCLEEITLFVLSSSFALAFSDNLHFFETAKLTIILLRNEMKGVHAWKNIGPAFQKRGQPILAKLRDEGLTDKIELDFRCDCFDDSEHRSDCHEALQMYHDHEITPTQSESRSTLRNGNRTVRRITNFESVR
ncbi:hypothetical protein BLNAU_1914 [Blattamonas nauphoetae]|uniref:Uncharacterized protein n=1 Tax=Blattamonas nauphoetae TaxID=2049346 RepID=A0ABQ9YGL5_9EUKA|nr:hypothetical protein BLNAU_1914 [Blattamonas nauphoetae]